MFHALDLSDPPDHPHTVLSPAKAGRDAAREAITARMAEKGFDNPRQLALRAGVGYATVHNLFREGSHWPRGTTRGKIEQALGWKPGELARIARAADELAATPAGRQQPRRRQPSGGTSVSAADSKFGRSDDSSVELLRSKALDEEIVLDFAPGALEGLTAAEAQEVQAAALLAALERMRQIRELRRDEHGSATHAADGHPGKRQDQ